ncbi:uncharacterized protein ACR2FA_010039 [Aphomia sociella]
MSSKRGAIRGTKLLAKLVDKEKGACAICQQDVDDEIIYGKLYVIGDIKCHYFCVLLSCCLMQKGKDEEGLFGFLYPDILAEIERSKKHRCSYCSRVGATLGCCISQCRKQFHLPCGRSRNAVSLFYGSYKTYCQNHAPKQIVADNIMMNAKLRLEKDRKKKRKSAASDLEVSNVDSNAIEETVCVICYEEVAGYPTPQTFWPPCCARDAWFHRTCLQRMALSAGMHYLKCPLCNDKESFYEAVVSQGYYVPDRDAAWELEQNAFAEIYERETSCDAARCDCPRGRRHDGEGPWDIRLCILCGSSGVHLHCLSSGSAAGSAEPYVCRICRPAAPADLEQLANNIEAVILSEQPPRQASRRPLMRCRMSLRSTKRRDARSATSCTSQDYTDIKTEQNDKASIIKMDTATSRQELNLKSPKRPYLEATVHKNIEIQSPGKLLEYSLKEVTRQSEITVDPKLLEQVRLKFRKPKPLSEKKRIVTDIIENLINSSVKEVPKTKEAVKEWCSPKKVSDIKYEYVKEQQENIAPNNLQNCPFNTETTPKKLTPPPISIEEDTQDCIMMTPTKTEQQENTTPNKSQNSPFNTESTPKKLTQPPIPIEEDTQDCIMMTPTKTVCIDIEDSSNSTFQLAPEFVADHISDDSVPLCETPKLKTVDIQKDSSLEISENNEVVNVSVVKMEESNHNNDIFKELNLKSPNKTKKCAFKFSPIDKETLQNDNVGIDMESFKNQYLNEVGRDLCCKFNHNHSKMVDNGNKLITPIDFAIEAHSKRKIRDSSMKAKRRRLSKKKYVECNVKYKENDTEIEVSNDNSNLKLSLASERRKKRKKKSTKLSIKDKNIKVKIKWREEQLKLKITDSKSKKDTSPKNLKQYVLNYGDGTAKDVLEKPNHDLIVPPMKKKHVKLEKSPDHMKQTSIQSFFKSLKNE